MPVDLESQGDDSLAEQSGHDDAVFMNLLVSQLEILRAHRVVAIWLSGAPVA